MNIRKCPKCGGNVPEGNANCNHCGHKMFIFGGNGLYVGSSKNANKLDTKDSPFNSNKNNNGCFIWIIIFIVIVSFIANFIEIFSVTMNEDDYNNHYYDVEDEYEELTCDDLCIGDYDEFNNHCLCKNGYIYNENYDVEHYGTGNSYVDNSAKCRVYCDDINSSYVDDKCICSDGKYFDIDGNEINPSDLVDTNANDRTVSDWYKDTSSGRAVVTVLCESNNYNCSNYRPEIENLAKTKKFNLYYFNIDKLTDSERETLTKTYTFRTNTNLNILPFTFIVEGNKFVDSTIGHPTTTFVEIFLESHNII